MTAVNLLHLGLLCLLSLTAVIGLGLLLGTIVGTIHNAIERWAFHRRMRAIVRGGPGVRAVRLATWKKWICR